jgi:branched-subunit amino acid ABC-type transport system permease component
VYISAGYQGSVALFVIIVMLLLRPQGLFGSDTRHA